jgi:hypothetical protein
MALSEGIQVLAAKIQEGLMQGDVCARLRDAVADYARAQGNTWDCYYIDHDGDGETGNVIYCCDGDIRQTSYEIGGVAGKAQQASIDFDGSKNVCPITTYVPEAEDSDHYTSMEASMRGDRLYNVLPVYERFIPKSTRKAASADSFAGKGKSFPILKAEDVGAALHSIGRAGPGNYSSDTIRANIKRIAKAKGFALPDSLKDDQTESGALPATSRTLLGNVGTTLLNALRGLGSLTEAQVQSVFAVLSKPFVSESPDVNRGTPPNSTWKPDGILLCEASRFMESPRLAEAVTTDYPIKLISPGRGSSGYYPPEVLKKAAEAKVFKAGTQMFWNHDTDAEESARPEGDLDRLAAVTTTDAAWNESGHDGPGLYARAKVFSDYASKVQEKGPHIGLSIRAGGNRDEAATGPDGKKGVITALKNAASVDFVTKAGRDGKIFTESATAQEGEEMDKTEIQALFKEALDSALAPLRAENKKLTEAIAQQKLEKVVPSLVEKALSDVRLPDATKKAIVEKFSTPTILGLLPMKEGAIDETELGKMVEAEAIRQRDYLVALGYGSDIPAVGVRMTEAELKQTETQREAESTQVMESLAEIFVGEKREGDPLREKARVTFMKGRAA